MPGSPRQYDRLAIGEDDESESTPGAKGESPWATFHHFHREANRRGGPHTVRAVGALMAFVVMLAIVLSLSSSFSRAPTSSYQGREGVKHRGADGKGPTDVLVLYAYHETPDARQNAEFFLKHGLHANADFVFIVNGPAELTFPSLPNTRTIQRENRCFDLGGYGEVLNADARALVKRYTKFILLNASVLGPFLPHWSQECWSDAYLNRLTPTTKLVGMSVNCWTRNGVEPHVQSMIWATDRVGVEVLLDESIPHSLSECPEEMTEAVEVEVKAAARIMKAGYKVDAMMQEFQSDSDYMASCVHDDYLYANAYFGGNIHPYETIFAKTKRGIQVELLGKLKEWTDSAGYSSYDYC